MSNQLRKPTLRVVRLRSTWVVFAVVVVALVAASLALVPRTSTSPTTAPALRPIPAVQSHDPFTFVSATPQVNGFFGSSVAVSGDTIAVGAPSETSGGDAYAGNVYLLTASTGAPLRTLTSPTPQYTGYFGHSVAISGSTVVVGAPGENVSGQAQAGHAYVFSTSGTLLATLASPIPEDSGHFGWQVAISGSLVAVSAPYENVPGSYAAGHVYVFTTSGSLRATLTSPWALTYGDYNGTNFGYSLALSGKTLAVGAPYEMAPGGYSAGHVYIFKATNGALLRTLTSPNAQQLGRFGWSVAISGKTLLVGAPGEEVAGQANAGRAYAMSLKTGSVLTTFVSPNAALDGYFGASVSISKKTVVVGASGESVAGNNGAGHAYRFSTSGTPLALLVSLNVQAQGAFGWSVAINGKVTVVGAPDEAVLALSQAGHAYEL
jgi:FG-GAP repeat